MQSDVMLDAEHQVEDFFLISKLIYSILSVQAENKNVV